MIKNFNINNYELTQSEGVFTLKNDNTNLGFVRFKDDGEVEYIFINQIFKKNG